MMIMHINKQSFTNALKKMLLQQKRLIPCLYRVYGTKHRLEKAVILSQNDLDERNQEPIPDVLHNINNPLIIYSSYVDQRTVKLPHNQRQRLEQKIKQMERKQLYEKSVPLIIEKFISSTRKEGTTSIPKYETETEQTNTVTYYPYSYTENIEVEHSTSIPIIEEESRQHGDSEHVKDEIALRMEAYDKGIFEKKNAKSEAIDNVGLKMDACNMSIMEEKDVISGSSNSGRVEDPGIFERQAASPNNQSLGSEEQLMSLSNQGLRITDLEEYEAALEEEEGWSRQGTTDPSVPVSKVPCGGCGAHLHCQEMALAGFVPKEHFVGLNAGELRGVLCQRCYFLKHCNTALDVRVSPELYPKLLEPIKEKDALALVVIDLTDMPCSIWPNLMDILGTRRPVVIVGNKVDLLPADGKNHLERVRNSLMATVQNTSLGRSNIVHTALVSALTGFGIESLITKIQSSWGSKGDIYLLGCTNSGKSSIFNTLLESDMCKTQASSLVPRATVSPWPGTTLNMLKFPVLRPSGYRLHLRVKRLMEGRRSNTIKANLPMYSQNPLLATLRGDIGRTFKKDTPPTDSLDPFSVKMSSKIRPDIVGINPSHPAYSLSKWCYDTPGTVQPEQMINLLTHEELMQTLPRSLILPFTFCLQPGHTLLLGGLARLDVIYSPRSVRFTVFRSQSLPLTIVKTVDASAFYRSHLGLEVLGVPMGSEERLKNWPALKPKDLRMYSTDKNKSCADVVLSSAGWVSVTGVGDGGEVVEVRGWTPGGRGIHLRQPAVLPLAVTLKGHRRHHSVTHAPHKIYVTKV